MQCTNNHFKLVAILIALVLPCSLFTQKSYAQEDFRGIGIFKIGISTTQTLNEFVTKNGIKIKESTSLMDTYGNYASSKKTSNVLLLRKSEKDQYLTDPKYSEHPDVKVYYVNYYEVAGIGLKTLYLEFYKDTLYDLQCDYSTELVEAISLKYGKGVDSTATKKIQCTGRLAGNFEVEEFYHYTKWSSINKQVQATACIGEYYNSKCEKQILSYFVINNSELKIRIGKEESAIKSAQEEKNNNDKKSKLSDF